MHATWMRTVMTTLVLAGVLGGAAAPADAGEKEKAAAAKLVKLVVPLETYDQMIAQMVSGMSEQFGKDSPKLPADVEKRIHAAISDVMSYADVLDWTADIYGARFTVDEIGVIEKFYRTPVGKKVMKLLPELSGEMGRKVATVLPERLPAALKKHGLLLDEEAPAAEPAPAPAPDKKP